MTNNSSKRIPFYWVIIGFILGIVVGIMQQRSSSQQDPALFSYDGKEYRAEQLPPALARQFHDLGNEFYNQQKELIQQAAMEVYLADEAAQRKLTQEQAAQEILGVQAPTEEEIAQFYTENEGRINRPLPQVKEQIGEFLMHQRRMEKQHEVVDRLQHENRLRILLEPPASPNVEVDTAGRPSKGEPSAPVTIIEFADYQCPHCKVATATLDKLLEEHPDKLQLVYMDFPINPSGVSRKLAEGSYCAEQQGQYWPYNNLAFTHQSSLNQESALAFARQLELDVERFESCLGSEDARQWVAKSEKQAIELGIRGTPAIFINGQRFQGHDLEHNLEQAVLDAVKAR